MIEIAIRTSNQVTGNTNRDLMLSQEGEIILAPTPARSKYLWEVNLAKGWVTQALKDDAEIRPGFYRYPWSNPQLKRYLICVIDEAYSDEQIHDLTKPKYRQDGLEYDGVPNLIPVKKSKWTVGALTGLTYFSTPQNKYVNFSQDSVDNIKNKNKVIQVRYDKPLPLTHLALVS